jgi:hypothetical protein
LARIVITAAQSAGREPTASGAASPGQLNARGLPAAMLSGMSLVADFLIRCDGSETMNAHLVAKAVREVGEEMGLVYNRLRDGHPEK